ncbi:MAG: hypothetical protein NVS1B10_05830 [Candidatus Saccharimonadales bacterium]
MKFKVGDQVQTHFAAYPATVIEAYGGEDNTAYTLRYSLDGAVSTHWAEKDLRPVGAPYAPTALPSAVSPACDKQKPFSALEAPYGEDLYKRVAEAMQSSGTKHDDGKPDLSLLSSIAVVKVAKVMTFGKRKYTAHNWRAGFPYSRLLAAALRHVFAYLGGESVDPESGESHLAHACCCLFMLLEFEDTKPHLDDRYKQSEGA